MNVSEGKINPACSLHTYLKVKPEDISYNFACRLEEYRVNSETGYVIQKALNSFTIIFMITVIYA